MSTTTGKRKRSPRGTLAERFDRPTNSDNAELRRHLGAYGRRMQACYLAGLRSRPRNPSWEWYGDEHLAWIDGRHERNRRRQERLAAALYRLCASVLRVFCRRCRKHHPKTERRLRRFGARLMRSVRRRQERRDRRRWDWSPAVEP